MEMRSFEEWTVNSFSGFHLRWYLLPTTANPNRRPPGGKTESPQGAALMAWRSGWSGESRHGSHAQDGERWQPW